MPTPQEYAAALQQQQQMKQGVTPTSTAGMLGNADAYNQYAQEQIMNGQQPLPRQQFLQQMQMQQMQPQQGGA